MSGTPFHTNLKFLRKRREISQQALADVLDMKRSTLSAYENQGAEPTLNALLIIADYFGLSVDQLIRTSLSSLSANQLSELLDANKIDYSGKKIRVIATTIDIKDRENIELISQKAKAGYADGYADPEFIKELPKYQLPFLNKNQSYRTFQISGDSMPPVPDGAWVTGSYVENWKELKNGKRYILLLKEEGIVFKLVYQLPEKAERLLLVSQNPLFAPFEVSLKDILEVWQYEHHVSKIDL